MSCLSHSTNRYKIARGKLSPEAGLTIPSPFPSGHYCLPVLSSYQSPTLHRTAGEHCVVESGDQLIAGIWGRHSSVLYLEGTAHPLRCPEFIHREHTPRREEHRELVEPHRGSVRAGSEWSLLSFYFKH